MLHRRAGRSGQRDRPTSLASTRRDDETGKDTHMPQSIPEHPPTRATYLPKEEAGLSFPPDRTALLVIDPVNDFLSEGGAGWELTKTTVEKRLFTDLNARDVVM